MSSINNSAYIVSPNAGQDIIVPVGGQVEHIYDSDKSIYLMGYDSINYHEYMSKSLMNLANSISDLNDDGIATSDAALIVSRDEAITAVRDSVGDIEESIKTLAKEEVLLSIDDLTTSISDTETAISSIKLDMESVKAVVGDDADGLFHNVEILKNRIGDNVDGLIADVESNHSATIAIASVIGEGIVGKDPLSNNLIPQLQLNTEKIELEESKTTALEVIVGDSNNGLFSDNILLKEKVLGIADDQSDGIYQIIKGSGGLVEQFNLFKDNLNVDSLTDSLIVIEEHTDKISTLEGYVGDSANGLVKTSSGHTVTIAQHSTDLGSVLDETGLLYDMAYVKSKIGSITTDNTILKDLKIIDDADVTLMNEYVIGLAADRSDGLKYKVDHIESDVIIPRIESEMTYGDIYYDGQRLYEILDTLDATSMDALKVQFDAYFLNDSTGTYHSNIVGQDLLDSWVADDTSSGFSSTLNTALGTDTLITSIKDDIDILNGSVSTNGSVLNTVDDLRINLYGDPTDESVGSLGDFETRIASIESISSTSVTEEFVNAQFDLSKTTYIDPIVEDVSLIKTQLDGTGSIQKDIDELHIESAKYLTILPWLKTIFIDVINESTSASELTTKFDNAINQIENVIENSIFAADFTTAFDDTNAGQFGLSLSIDQGTQFEESTNLLLQIELDSKIYKLTISLTADEINSGVVERTSIVNDWIYTPDEGDSESLQIYESDADKVTLRYSIIDLFDQIRIVQTKPY